MLDENRDSDMFGRKSILFLLTQTAPPTPRQLSVWGCDDLDAMKRSLRMWLRPAMLGLCVWCLYILYTKTEDMLSCSVQMVDPQGHPERVFSKDSLPCDTTSPCRPKAHTKVILLTYMRSGSTLTGDILSAHPDVFYVFEPLHFLSKEKHTVFDYLRLRQKKVEHIHKRHRNSRTWNILPQLGGWAVFTSHHEATRSVQLMLKRLKPTRTLSSRDTTVDGRLLGESVCDVTCAVTSVMAYGSGTSGVAMEMLIEYISIYSSDVSERLGRSWVWWWGMFNKCLNDSL
ncbi:uncharacterized protein [Haliotis asinina]|uniref:uncharacterized protein n=1 Tax=Haliotis asinina TaxID=109174 RepID=UPI003531E3F3